MEQKKPKVEFVVHKDEEDWRCPRCDSWLVLGNREYSQAHPNLEGRMLDYVVLVCDNMRCGMEVHTPKKYLKGSGEVIL